MNIKYKVDFDFISYMHLVANIKEIRKHKKVSMKQGSATKDNKCKKKSEQYFKDAEIYYNETLSYIQRNELDMFFNRTSCFYNYLMSLAIADEALENQTLSDFKQYILETLEIEDQTLTPKLLIKEIVNHYDDPNSIDDYQKETELILETLKDERMFNTNFKNAVASLKKTFIETKYLPNKETYDKKLAEHNAIYEKDPFEFLSNISTGIIQEDDLRRPNLQPYITFLAGFKLMLEVKPDYSVMVYNSKLENVNREEYEKDIIVSLLKFLSDPKRYQMIRMLTKEKWYANELAKKFNITPATMSYHVNKLFALGLISFEQRERNKLYIELDRERLSYLLKRVRKDLTGESDD